MFQNHFACLFRNHDDGGIGITGSDSGHYGAINNAQSFHTTYTKLIINNSEFIIPHTTGTDGFVVNVTVFAKKGIKLCVAGTIGTGIVFLTAILGVGRLIEDFPGYPYTTPQCIAVTFVSQIVGVDDWLDERIG